MKKVIVVSSQKSAPVILTTEASKFGELKRDLSNQGFGDLSNSRVVVKETKATLEFEEAVLPDTDFTLFISPKEIKAGSQDIVGILETLKEKFLSKVEEAFNETIEEVEDGVYTIEDSTPLVATSTPRISAEDQDFLAQMKNMR